MAASGAKTTCLSMAAKWEIFSVRIRPCSPENLPRVTQDSLEVAARDRIEAETTCVVEDFAQPEDPGRVTARGMACTLSSRMRQTH